MLQRSLIVLVFVLAAAVAGTAMSRDGEQNQKPGSGWTIPADADKTKNPLPADEKTLAAGRAVYKENCSRCHGPAGKGDGPDADLEDAPNMDITQAKNAADNPDGVVFNKVLNGRRSPKMQAFKDKLTEQQIWSVVAYVQTLRKK